MSKLTTLDFLNPIHFDSPIYSYEDLYVYEQSYLFDWGDKRTSLETAECVANIEIKIFLTIINQISKKNILVIQSIYVPEGIFTKDNYTKLTNDFTQYLDYMLLGKELNEDNLYPKILADFAAESTLDCCEILMKKLRLALPSKEFQYILLPRSEPGDPFGNYIMNIGGTGFTPIICNVNLKRYVEYHKDPDCNLKNEYKECLDKFLLETNFTPLGKKIFIVFFYVECPETVWALIDPQLYAKDNELYFAENFRIQLSDYINNILFDIPLKFFRNRFEEVSKALYNLPEHTEVKKALDDSYYEAMCYNEVQIAEYKEYDKKYNESKPYVRKLMDEYVNELKNRYPEIEFRYIVLPDSELRKTNIILNLKNSFLTPLSPSPSVENTENELKTIRLKEILPCLGKK